MSRKRIALEATCCPFIDRNDPRCEGLFTLRRLSEAFELCLGGHHGCSTYHTLRREPAGRIHLTIRGRATDTFAGV